MDDKSSYERISIRESAASLKKYGSTSRHVSRNENYIKHYVSNTDTLQGIALKYNVTVSRRYFKILLVSKLFILQIEQIRRVNKLWASDSLFLREFLLIPSSEPSHSAQEGTSIKAENNPVKVTSPTSNSSFDCDDNIDEFLNKIDAAIATTKEDVKKTTKNSE